MTLPHVAKVEYEKLVFCQIFEWPAQKLTICHLIKTMAHEDHHTVL